ncbi:MAG: hypothetical protein N2558_02930 [Patescibacteria group bacterium]|nr:hypothetical protein [Patescibacteria group bacterium]
MIQSLVLEIVKAFFAGLFLFNSLPHLIKGVIGQSHMTPFKRVSSPYLNLAWAFLNIGISLVLVETDQQAECSKFLSGWSLLSFFVGGIFISFANAQLFSNPNAKLPWHKY